MSIHQLLTKTSHTDTVWEVLVNYLMCIFGFWEEKEKWINFKNKTENLKSLSKYKTEKTEHSVLTDEICLSERKR